jgi:hypothetical protein
LPKGEGGKEGRRKGGKEGRREGGKEGRRGKRGNCFLSFFSCPAVFSESDLKPNESYGLYELVYI